MSIHIVRRGGVIEQAGKVWQPDPAGLFGGQQLVSNRAGVYSQAAIGTSGNWNGNSRRAHDSQNEHILITDAENLRLLWANDINDQLPPQAFALTVSSGSLGGTFVVNTTFPTADSTSAIAYNASASDFEDALETLTGIPAGSVTCTKTGTANAPVWTVSFSAAVIDAPVFTLTTAGLTGTGAAGTVTPIVWSTPQVALGLCNGASANALALDLRALATPSTSLGDGMSSAVTVAPRDALFGVPGSAQSASNGGTVLGRVSVDRGNDTTTHRFPVQTTQTPEDIPANTGASQNVTGAGTKHAHDTKATWDAYASGRLGFLNTTLLGDPVDGPITNVLILGDSVENASLDSTSVKDPQRAYVRRAIKSLQDGGMDIAAWSMAQGNETLQNLRVALETTSNLRRKILGAGCWSHVYIGHARNDIQNGRTAAQVIADYEAVLSLIRATTPDLTKVFLGTLPPYTDPSNNRLASSVMDTVLAWQLNEATDLFDHVFDVGAVGASQADRQKWAHTNLGDPITRIADGIHFDTQTHTDAAVLLVATPVLWRPTGA